MEQEQTPLPFTPHEAWGHMREALDREMPVKKRRRRLIFWLLPLMVTGIIFTWRQSATVGNKTVPQASNLPDKASAAATKGSPAATIAEPPVSIPPPNQVQPGGPVAENAIPHQNRSLQTAGANRYSVVNGPGSSQKPHLERTTPENAPVFKRAAQPETATQGESAAVLFESAAETEADTPPELPETAYSLTVPHPLLLNTAAQHRLAAISTPFFNSNPAIQPAPVKAGLRPPPVYFGIRTGLVLNHAGWIRNKKPLFPQRITPLELFIEKPLGKKYSAELSVNLFSSRNIHYALRKQESVTDVAGNYQLRDHRHTAQALHFTDMQALLLRNLTNGWQVHGGIYFSVLKNIAVEVNNYDSSARPTATGHSFINTTETGYTYARKLDSVNLVSPFRKTDIGLLAGVSYRKKQWQAGITAQAGLPRLYSAAADADTKGPARTLQLKLWLGLRIKR